MDNKIKGLAILGSTGSVGRQTLDVVRSFSEAFSVIGLAAGYNVDLLTREAEEFHPKVVSCQEPGDALASSLPSGCQIVSEEELVSHPDVDMVVAASVGKAGLKPIIAAIQAGKTVVLANKEPIVMAGEIVMEEAKRNGVAILPVDSEPSAIWQCLRGEDKELSRIIITASGGPFRNRTPDQLFTVTPEEALKHPTWSMGRKITIDSATLMNKGFEVIESRWLFDLPWEKIDVVIHPQSIIHAMVEFVDGSVKAQLSPPDMRMPIQHALFYPQRMENASLTRFNPVETGSLTFEELDVSRYPCFKLALEAGKKGSTYPAVLSAADDVAVELFLDGAIGFTAIPNLVEYVLSKHNPASNPDIETILEIDDWARKMAYEWIR
jgi:1-deoxy-D-xylulose-5-phosphate reductoisomerase